LRARVVLSSKDLEPDVPPLVYEIKLTGKREEEFNDFIGAYEDLQVELQIEDYIEWKTIA
jgi:hypothetical protein